MIQISMLDMYDLQTLPATTHPSIFFSTFCYLWRFRQQSSSVSDGNIVTELNQAPLTTRRKLNSIMPHYSRLTPFNSSGIGYNVM